jgi:enoyl-CoA hydratase/carnithine racemase
LQSGVPGGKLPPTARHALISTSFKGRNMSAFEHIIVETKGAVGIIQLNRPKMLNALSFGVFKEIARAVDVLEADDAVGAIIITGNEKAFAAGADIKEMQPKGYIDMFNADFIAIGGDRVAPAASRPSPLSAAMRSAAAANWR